MKKRYFLVISLTAFIIFRVQHSFAEGSKEIYIGTYWTWFFMCNDFVNHCGDNRSNFAIYGCDETSRLCFVTKDQDEIVYFGFNIRSNSIPSGSHAVFRIKDLSGTVVYPETNVPTGGTGYIDFISEARNGPIQIYGTGGYIAIDWHPPAPDTYYMEFQVIDNSTGNITLTGMRMDLLDVTVYDSVALQTKPGRLYCKAWQFEEANNYSGTIYVYSPDSIITSAVFSNMDGGIWNIFCNEWGCANTGNFGSDRKSVQQLAFLPQYPVFLNPPDSTVFYPAKLFGQIVPPDPWSETNCSNGDIVFHVNVNKAAGIVEIDLTFPGPFTNRILMMNAVSGENLLIWDGLDGSGVMVPNNILVTYVIKYINGLTNLPLYDVEDNSNGFFIGLVSPSGNTPLVYWDDSNIPTGTMNLTGCSSPPGCHPFPYSVGNVSTVNTWWYLVSDSLPPAAVIEKRESGLLVFNQSPPQSFCGDTTGIYYSVIPDPATEIYNWNYTGTGVTIHHLNPADNFVTLDFAGNATSGNITVYGTNANCPEGGPISSLAITSGMIPVMNLPYSGTICTGDTTNIILSSTPPGATFSWTSPAPACSANIISCPPGQNNSTQITDILSVSDNNPGTVTYHITPKLSQCNGPLQDYMMTVNLLQPPVITGNASVCEGSSGNVYSMQAGMSSYVWSISSGGTITGGGTLSDHTVTVTWNTAGARFVTGVYYDPNGCVLLDPTTFPVQVNSLPAPLLNGIGSICAGLSTIDSTDPGMATYIWSVSAGGSIIAGGGSTNNTVTVLWNTAGAQTVSVNYQMGNGCTAPNPTVLDVTVKPKPVVTNAGNSSVCSGGTTNIIFQSSLPGTTFSWTATGSSADVIGYSASSGPSIIQTLQNTGYNVETVTYGVTPSLSGCDGVVADFVVTVYPVTDVYFNPAGQSICSGLTTNINLASHVTGATFTWTASVTSGTVIGFGPGSGTSITQTLINTGFDVATVTYTVTPTAHGCQGMPGTVIVTVVFAPTVAFALCNDAITTISSKPFRLKGGIPLGGIYSGAGVTNGIFNPSIAGIGSHQITYTYTNAGSCSSSATITIVTIVSPVTTCGQTITDIRDGKTYQTVHIGSQCWFAEDLNYGTEISSNIDQRDNCIAEKYHNPASSIQDPVSVYQWDELMNYDVSISNQGLCPPGWHVPSETDWDILFANYVNNGFAASPLKYSGFSGFNALLSGAWHLNKTWDWSGFATFFWSSTSHGTLKAWAHGMNDLDPSVSAYPSFRNNAFSVRCLKD